MKNSQKCDFRGQNFDFQSKIRKINHNFQGLNPSKRRRPSFHDTFRFPKYTFHNFNTECGQEEYHFLGFVPKKRGFWPKMALFEGFLKKLTPRGVEKFKNRCEFFYLVMINNFCKKKFEIENRATLAWRISK